MADVATRKLVSVLYPVLNEEENARALAARMLVLTQTNPAYDFEFVVVDDGSTDNTVAVLREALAPGLVLRTLSLARNFGSHAAISAGLELVAGDAVIILGADLQEPPKLVTDFLAAWEEGYETAWGIRQERKVPSWKSRLASAVTAITAPSFQGLRFTAHDIRRFTAGPGIQAIMAHLIRRVNQEANPQEEQTLLIAERDSGVTSGPYQLAYAERMNGLEEEVATPEVIGGVLIAGHPTLIVARDGEAGVAYAMLERTGARRWRLRWLSAPTRCG